jgi:LmbE family N-acetylglucosaminyl deacetylase
MDAIRTTSHGNQLPPRRLADPATAAADLGTILSVWAHPDDETYLAGATMAAAADRGQRVVCVSASVGERGTSDPATWPPSRLGPVRRWEAAAAMAVLGVRDHRILGLPDGRLDDHGDLGPALVGDVIDEVRPDTILTFGPDGMTFHPDHVAVHRWTTEAWIRAGRRGRLLYAASPVDHLRRFRRLYEELGIYMTGERPVGVPAGDLALHCRAEGRALDRKLTALRAMTSQTSGLFAAVDPGLLEDQVAVEAFVAAGPTG